MDFSNLGKIALKDPRHTSGWSYRKHDFHHSPPHKRILKRSIPVADSTYTKVLQRLYNCQLEPAEVNACA